MGDPVHDPSDDIITQRGVGNRATGRTLRRKPVPGDAGRPAAGDRPVAKVRVRFRGKKPVTFDALSVSVQPGARRVVHLNRGKYREQVDAGRAPHAASFTRYADDHSAFLVREFSTGEPVPEVTIQMGTITYTLTDVVIYSFALGNPARCDRQTETFTVEPRYIDVVSAPQPPAR